MEIRIRALRCRPHHHQRLGHRTSQPAPLQRPTARPRNQPLPPPCPPIRRSYRTLRRARSNREPAQRAIRELLWVRRGATDSLRRSARALPDEVLVEGLLVEGQLRVRPRVEHRTRRPEHGSGCCRRLRGLRRRMGMRLPLLQRKLQPDAQGPPLERGLWCLRLQPPRVPRRRSRPLPRGSGNCGRGRRRPMRKSGSSAGCQAARRKVGAPAPAAAERAAGRHRRRSTTPARPRHEYRPSRRSATREARLD